MRTLLLVAFHLVLGLATGGISWVILGLWFMFKKR